MNKLGTVLLFAHASIFFGCSSVKVAEKRFPASALPVLSEECRQLKGEYKIDFYGRSF